MWAKPLDAWYLSVGWPPHDPPAFARQPVFPLTVAGAGMYCETVCWEHMQHMQEMGAA